MFQAADNPFLVPFGGDFSLDGLSTKAPEDTTGRKHLERRLADSVERMAQLQRKLYASDDHALLLVFQAMDAAGKDSTIRAVTSGINPAGFQVYSFKQPSREELDHDFLWRTVCRLPERGRIGVFNRSYYEEVLVVKVHPEYLEHQRLPDRAPDEQLFAERLESIRDHELHLARNGTVILKFWLNVSKKEQKRRFLDRVEKSHKNWKFTAADVAERQHWKDYMRAYQEALQATSKPWAPWYAIPADNKPFMRCVVADIIVEAMERMGLSYPRLSPDQEAQMHRLAEDLRVF